MKCAVRIGLNPFAHSGAHRIAIVVLVGIQKVVWMLQDAFVVATSEGFIDSVTRTSQFAACSCHELMHALTDIRVWGRGNEVIVITH